MIVYAATYLFIMSAAGFSVCAYDKRAAKSKRDRVSERSLYALAALGGSLGVFSAMLLAKHKTRKSKFMVIISIIMILQAAGVVYLLKVF